jgi:NAD(P)-dependent dehydrogenase (short-subunit alcohol dehydrogenase family)
VNKKGLLVMNAAISQGFHNRVFATVSILLTILTILIIGDSSPVMAESQTSTVLITGSNRGIGFGFVEAYAAKGWTVIATCRTPSKADDLHALAKSNPNIMIEELDVTDDQGIRTLADKYRDTPIDVLVNNAGILPELVPVRFDTVDYEKMDRMLAVNTWGPAKVSTAFIDHVAASKHKKIITMTSGEGSLGKIRRGGAYHYRVSKAAVNMMMLLISRDVAERGVIVGLINPGLVDTQGLREVDLATVPEAMRGPVQRMRESANMRTPKQAVEKLIPLIDGLTLETSGVFYDISGEVLPW